MSKPIAFIDESGFIVPNPVFSDMSVRYAKGRFIYSQAELDRAIQEMEIRRAEMRDLADKRYGADMVRYEPGEPIGVNMEKLDGQRETVPSFTASPKRKKTVGGASQKVQAPNQADLPASLHNGDNPSLQPAVDEDGQTQPAGIHSADAVRAIFKGQ